ncbi:WYL domain-containing protein [Actinopolymorpha sp. B9G3]|uniref:helix-turn-helix transcriptional regulator n=1 Tax=Actinopolymorpha sp. B9G3 TaxID=3158970 RepID=UPI0032D8C06E
MNRTDRLHALTEELRRAGPRGCSSQHLAERFAVSVSTIKRDVTAIQQAGTPIRARNGPSGGYVLEAEDTLPPVQFTHAQAMAVAAALAANSEALIAPDGAAALKKIAAVLDMESRHEVVKLLGRTQRPATESAPAPRVIDEALRQQRVVVLDYVDAKGESTRRRVEPLELTHTGDHWYLVGWCLRRDAVRWFRLDRVRSAHLTPDPVVGRDLPAIGAPPPDAGPVGVVINLDTARRRR